MQPISQWFRRTFNDPQVVLLVVLIVGALLIATFVAGMIAPVIAAVVIAFLLDGPAEKLRRLGLTNLVAVSFVFIGFIFVLVMATIIVLPPLSGQVVQFFDLLPNMIGRLRTAMLKLPESYPELLSQDQVREIIDGLGTQLAAFGTNAVNVTVQGLTSAVTLLVYMILISVMVFFFLKDKRLILTWLSGFLPTNRTLASVVWREAVERAGDYARGKVYEIIIVGVAGWITYQAVGLQFATLLAVATGLSVLIPYIGAAVVTVPVALVAFFQWGLGSDWMIAVGAYLVLQAIDGNLLAPLLFSEVVKLHPIAIIIAILIFGGIWGLWGVFFAIPLATVTHAVIKAWPRDNSSKSSANPEVAV